MGLFDDIGRGALGWATGGLSELGRRDPFGVGGGGNGDVGPNGWNPLTAKKIGIPTDLAATLGTVGSDAYNKIGSNYAGAKTKLANESIGRGMSKTTANAPNSYGNQRLAATQGLDVGNLESSIGGQIGSTAYNNALKQRDYGQNMSLADQVAALNRPDLLQQIFGGIGAVGRPVATYYGMNGRGGSPGGSPSVASSPAPSYYDYA